MNKGQTIFAQVMKYIPHKAFARCVATYNGERYVKLIFNSWSLNFRFFGA